MTAEIVTLSRLQIRALLEDRLDGTGPCLVKESLPWSELAATSIVPGARILMAELAGDGARLTARGNLSRRLVEVLMDRTSWPDCDPAELRSISKVFNEEDFDPAMYLHAVLRLAGVARHHKGLLKLTRKGSGLLCEDSAGRLHATLFRVTFSRYNLAYLDRIGEPDIFSPQISLILYLIGRFGAEWQADDALMRGVTLPMETWREPRSRVRPEFAFHLRVLRYLCWFGLLEEGRPAANDDWQSPCLFRKTPLYDQALSFALN